jgi:hypothetical protein
MTIRPARCADHAFRAATTFAYDEPLCGADALPR